MLTKTEKGNLFTVYRAVVEQAENFINHLVETQRPTDAEISEEKADWYLVRTFPGDDVRAMRWLARRRFGIFRPMQQRRLKRNNPLLVQGWEPVFPGWLFVFCWNIKKMRTRIQSCPGVMGILSDPVTKAPFAVDRADENGVLFIDKLRALSWVYDENAPVRSNVTVTAARHIKRIKPKCQKVRKSIKNKLRKLKKDLKRQGKWEPSTWECANELAPHERIALMLKTLNAPSLGASPR